ncbi:OmpA family protein [Lutimonas zeaxanthinifaciens]|uniref:OmpA family protein n=1 Tax=Lutimonas zeaxanthinifaciens TaxID=3060215 RepID=UPI00265C9F07|nr:OmpA family protein [Lutimonas sp. YSD2104]WKK65801.1 OmpA family protein [Lutimonas sp. YSD2104]
MKKYILVLLLFSIGVLYAQTEGAGKYAINRLTINTKNSDFGAAFFGEDKLVFASPKKGITLVNDVWEDNNQRFLELYVGDILPNGDLEKVSLVPGEVNTRYHEADVAFTRDRKTVYFTRNNFYNKKLARDEKQMANLAMFKATVNDKGEWVNIIPMPFNNVEYSVGHPALSQDEKTLYFISDMPGSYGQTDIFKVSINQSGFGNPVNLGWKINSPAKEFSPFVDGEVLYFSSDKEGGMGGFDIYATRLVDYTPEPILLNEPINSTADDLTFIINSKTRKGYFSSNRSGGEGDDDIYSFIEEEAPVFRCSQLITGEVRDQNTTEIIRGAVVAIKDTDGNLIKEVVVDEEGVFELPAFCETEYKLEGSKEGYTTQKKSFTTSAEADKKVKLLILLGTGEIVEQVEPVVAVVEDKPEGMPEELPEEIVKVRPSTYVVNIEPIYFELNSSYLNKEAKRELDKVVDLMNKYPEMIIESGSHTDSRGITGYNIWLSTRRAASTVNYILERGIDPSRITGKGYGETQLINGCADGIDCTEAQHAMNRRTEFVIIKM